MLPLRGKASAQSARRAISPATTPAQNANSVCGAVTSTPLELLLVTIARRARPATAWAQPLALVAQKENTQVPKNKQNVPCAKLVTKLPQKVPLCLFFPNFFVVCFDFFVVEPLNKL